MPIAQHMSAALAPGSKEGGVSLGGWVWAQGLFFTTGGGRDHIKFFIGAPQDEAGPTRKFEMSHVGGATCRTPPIPRSAPPPTPDPVHMAHLT